jgi:SAM-dependent methyltransferase
LQFYRAVPQGGDEAQRHADGDGAGGDVVGHHGTGADDHATADRDATQEPDPRADPDVVLHHNAAFAGHEPLLMNQLVFGVVLVIHRGERAVRRHQNVLADLDRFPYPFADGSFDRLTAIHVIEHLSDVMRAMEEFHRLVRRGGTVRIETPHYTDFSSFCDPTHKSHLNSFSFRYFGENHGGFGYYSKARFREISLRLKLLAFWRWLGFELLVNRFPRYRRFWEYYLCYVVRGKAMEFEFEVVK